MAAAQRPLYPKQQKKLEEILTKRQESDLPKPIVEKDGRHFIAVNESESDSYSPRQFLQSQNFSDKEKNGSFHPSLTNDDEKARNLLFSLTGGEKETETDEKEKKRKKVEQKIQKLNKLEMDGFSSLAESTTWCARVFWLILLLFVLSVLTYEIIKTIQDYQHNKVITTYTVILNDSMVFPVIYICPGNYLNDTYYRSHVAESRTAQAFQVSLVNQSDPKPNSRPKREVDYQQQQQQPNELNEWENELLHLNGFQQQKVNQNPINYDEEEEEAEWPFELLEEENRLQRVKRDVSNVTLRNSTIASNGTAGNVTKASAPPLLNMTADQVYDFMLDVGYDKNQMFLSCKFYQDNGTKFLPCSDVVKDVVDVNYGKCYSVAVGDLQQDVEARGLSLIIDTFKSRITRDPNVSKRYNGLFLAVHYKQVNPAVWEKIMVGGGTYMNLDVALEHLQLIDVRRSDFHQPCVNSDDAKLSVLDTPYSQSACQLDCFMKKIVDTCHCILMMDRDSIIKDVLAKNEFCSRDHGEKCIVPKITNNLDAVEDVRVCKLNCHVACESWRYKVNPSTMVLNPLAFDNLPANITYGDILQLDISYSRLEYVEFTQSLQTSVDTFIGNLGGQITGWVGGSMLTIIHIPILISKFLIRRSIKKARNTLAGGRFKNVLIFMHFSKIFLLILAQAAAQQNVIGFQNIISAQRSQQS